MTLVKFLQNRFQSQNKGSRATGANVRGPGTKTRKIERSMVGNPFLTSISPVLICLSKPKLKSSYRTDSDLEDVEVVDLAEEEPSPAPYENSAPREYRKLHKLHTSVQQDKVVRRTKQDPQFSYASGEQPVLSFLNNNEPADNTFDPEEFDDGYQFP